MAAFRPRVVLVSILLGATLIAGALWMLHPWQRDEAGSPSTSPVWADEEYGEWRLEPAFPKLRFERPVWMEQDRDGRWLLGEQGGRILRFDNQRDVSSTELVLDLRSKVSRDGNEEGLLGFALHPEEPRLFVVYSAAQPRRTVVSEFRDLKLESERVVLEIPQPWSNHNGGCVLFGPDGYLYLSVGDGGAAGDPKNNAQNRETLLGSILRLDVNTATRPYTVPTDNPFVGHANTRPEIWAYGLRNVWRMSFDGDTGMLWAADVGQNHIEEVNIILRGANYGWNFIEGSRPFRPDAAPASTIPPVFEYLQRYGKSVTGGYVYRGQKHPSLRGRYVFGDYISGTIWALAQADGRVTDKSVLVGASCGPASFVQGRDREVFVLCFDGRIHELAQGKPD